MVEHSRRSLTDGRCPGNACVGVARLGGAVGVGWEGTCFAFWAGGSEVVSVARNRVSRLGDLQITPRDSITCLTLAPFCSSVPCPLPSGISA